MKKIALIACAWFVCCATYAQPMGWYGVPNPDTRPVYNPYQFPNYYQNNASFVNNSMQTNPPPDPYAAPFTGNADYMNPTRIDNIPYSPNGSGIQSPIIPANTYIVPPPEGPAVPNSPAGR